MSLSKDMLISSTEQNAERVEEIVNWLCTFIQKRKNLQKVESINMAFEKLKEQLVLLQL